MVGPTGTTSPEVRRAFMHQVVNKTADSAVLVSVAVGLELALDILKEEIANEQQRREGG
jgi:hypothetical protein